METKLTRVIAGVREAQVTRKGLIDVALGHLEDTEGAVVVIVVDKEDAGSIGANLGVVVRDVTEWGGTRNYNINFILFPPRGLVVQKQLGLTRG